jgi:RNA polymerase sigma-70 factor (ECF subfamily)
MTMPQPASRPTSPPVLSGAPGFADHELVQRARAGDAAAFELIMRRYNRRLFRLARSILRNAAEAEDVVQETYVRAYVKLGDFIGPQGFSAWLCKIAVNEALGRVRDWARVVSLDDFVSDGDGGGDVRRIETMTSRQPDLERQSGNGELRRSLEDAIDALPDDFRTVFVLRAVEGMSVVETSEALSIRPETVKTRFHRARLRLQDALGARFDALMPAAYEFGGQRCDRIATTVLARLDASLEAARRNNNP